MADIFRLDWLFALESAGLEKIRSVDRIITVKSITRSAASIVSHGGPTLGTDGRHRGGPTLSPPDGDGICTIACVPALRSHSRVRCV